MECMYNIYDEMAVIDYSMEDIGIITVKVEGVTREFKRYETALRYLEKLGHRY